MKKMLESRIKKIAHGSVEIREKNEHKYIYVHFREEGLLITKKDFLITKCVTKIYDYK